MNPAAEMTRPQNAQFWHQSLIKSDKDNSRYTQERRNSFITLCNCHNTVDNIKREFEDNIHVPK